MKVIANIYLLHAILLMITSAALVVSVYIFKDEFMARVSFGLMMVVLFYGWIISTAVYIYHRKNRNTEKPTNTNP